MRTLLGKLENCGHPWPDPGLRAAPVLSLRGHLAPSDAQKLHLLLSWQPCAHLASPCSTPLPTAVGARVRPLQPGVQFSALQNPGFWHPEKGSELDTPKWDQYVHQNPL